VGATAVFLMAVAFFYFERLVSRLS
jgi:hypothetical protein